VHARIGWKALTADENVADGFVFLSTPNIKSAAIDFENVNYINRYRYDESPELKLELGDVLLAKDGSTLGICNVVRELPRPATVNGSIAVLRTRGAIEPRFLRYVLEGAPMQERINFMKTGMGVPHLFQWDINRFEVPCPPMDPQCQIVDLLDDQVARIDEIIRLREEQIVGLEAEHESWLSMEYETLGAAFGFGPLRHLLTRIRQGWSPQAEDRLPEPDEWSVLKAGCVNRGMWRPDELKALPRDLAPRPEFTVNTGDLLINRASGSLDLIGSAAVVRDVRERVLLCDKVYRAEARPDVSAGFIAGLWRARQVREHLLLGVSGAEGMANSLPSGVIRAVPVPMATTAAQHAWVARLSERHDRFADAISEMRAQIELLQERRRSLITAAVAGEFDVSTASGRGVA
jgi:type I restriction enzyme S subunit